MTAARISWDMIGGWLSATDWLVITSAGAGTGFAGYLFGASMLDLGAIGALGAVCTAIALVDARHFVIPDRLSLPLVPLGVVALLPDVETVFLRLVTAGAVWCGLSVFAAVARRARGAEAFGQGDVKLISIAGLWIGPDWIAPYIVATALGAIAVVVSRRVAGRRASDPRIAYGAFLAPALVGAVLINLAFAV